MLFIRSASQIVAAGYLRNETLSAIAGRLHQFVIEGERK